MIAESLAERVNAEFFPGKTTRVRDGERSNSLSEWDSDYVAQSLFYDGEVYWHAKNDRQSFGSAASHQVQHAVVIAAPQAIESFRRIGEFQSRLVISVWVECLEASRHVRLGMRDGPAGSDVRELAEANWHLWPYDCWVDASGTKERALNDVEAIYRSLGAREEPAQ